ncbi:MAG TPA: ATP-binding protein [Bdellovibrionales bacterium]|nr:ATP-binding protein [Bdellovibrionales bacterium]
MSIRVRLTILFVGIFTVTLLIFSSLLYNAFSETQQREFDVALYNHAVDIANSLDFDLFGSLSIDARNIYDQQKLLPFSLGRSLLQIRRLDGTTILRAEELGGNDLPFQENDFSELQDRGHGYGNVRARELGLEGENVAYRLINYVVKRPGYPMLILQIAVPKTLLEAERRGIRAFFILAVPLIILISAAGGYWFSRRALKPVKDIIAKTESIHADRLSERLPVPEENDEIRHLSETVNGLLQRLEDAFKSQERFIADASHQLKTPLAVLRGELDVLLRGARDQKEVDAFLESASQEIVSLSKTIEDLLLLARVDAGKAAVFATEVRLDDLVLTELARLEKLAKGKGVKLHFDITGFEGDETPNVKADRDLLGHLIYNLIENAIKYSPSSQVVRVTVNNGPRVELAVADRGPGIEAAEQERVFDRFYRVAQTRTTGVGLGLAIAQKIAQLHGAKITVKSEPGEGSRFAVEFKKGLERPGST